MANAIQTLLHACVQEMMQRSELRARLDDIRQDKRLLDDIGHSFEEISSALKAEQKAASPIRAWLGGYEAQSSALKRVDVPRGQVIQQTNAKT